MALRRLEPHPSQQAWAASGAISLDLSGKPYTITSMALVIRADVTTTTATNYNDYWDRLIARLNLTGRGTTFFDFSNLRALYHMSRFQLREFAPRRPTVVADSQTNDLRQFIYRIHFGVRPIIQGPDGSLRYNPWDLTAGIPAVEKGNLQLGGTFGAAAALGSANVTVNDGDFDVYLYGVQPEAGDPASAFMPQALPIWSMRTPTPTATSTAFGTHDNIPGGDYLHSMLVMSTRGSGAPRMRDVLSSLQVYSQLEAREILRYGGQSGAAADYWAAEILSQVDLGGAPPSDNGVTLGVPAVTVESDRGLVWLPVHQYALKGHPLYGVDLRGINTGDLQLRYGVASATTVTLDVLYRKYQINPAYGLV